MNYSMHNAIINFIWGIADAAYQNAMKNLDKQKVRNEHEPVLGCVMLELIADHIEPFKQFSDNSSFKKWLGDAVFGATYQSNN